MTQTYRILIVEDEEPIAKMIAMNLRVANYEPHIIMDGREACEALKERHDYDLMLLDVMLPGMDGFALFAETRQYGIPVIFLTAKDDLSSKIQGLTGGAEDYIVKPFEVLELLVRMEKVLSRSGKGKNVEYFLDLTIDYARHAVSRNGQEISLKPMEFQLLEVLLKNRNIAISREKLLGLVWGVDFVGETRTVDVHIGQLRKKLGLGEQIRTIPKIGYRLEDA
ncbi:MAG: response regulator transcription factor [Lachnospiraceae bacterium]|nr:response regulator transcription factor [Lachnospiraceae bacterium]MCI9151042.1 response regulator transcription factor [Lachnospiraceae bacterium]